MDASDKKRIVIIGDAGRGKTTLAKKLSKKLGVPMHSTDDLFWKVKFSIQEEPAVREQKASELFYNPEWIVEGTTHDMLKFGYEPSELIIHLMFPSIIMQWYAITRRAVIRHRNKTEKETIRGVFLLCRHVLYKKYKLEYKKNDPTIQENLAPYKHKVVELRSYKEIERFLNTLQSIK